MLIFQLLQPSQGDQAEPKRTRVSRLSPELNSRLKDGPLPSPITHQESTASEDYQEGTITYANDRPKQAANSQAVPSQRNGNGMHSPPSDTQAFTQNSYPPEPQAYAVPDEEEQEVWGYLVPMDQFSGDVMVLRRREACPVPDNDVGTATGTEKVHPSEWKGEEEKYEAKKIEKGVTSGGYLIGRHRECGKWASFQIWCKET
jgi:serine/threonine-protein kinase CHEK2